MSEFAVPAAAPSAPRSQAAPLQVTFEGNPWSLSGLCFLNALLILITIGIYWFWARSEYRRFMWQMVRVEGEPLEYTGTGRELLIGYVRLFLFVILPLIVLAAVGSLALGPRHPLVSIGGFIVYAGLFFLYYVGVFRAHRYILSRTRWRGVAFGLNGNAIGYAWTSFWSMALTGLTLGWVWPWRTVALRRRLTSAMYFGSVPFRFEGGSGHLYGPFAILWLAFSFYITAAAIIGVMQPRTQQNIPSPPNLQQLPAAAVAVIFAAILAAIVIAIIGFAWYEARKLNVFAKATWIDRLNANLWASAGSVLWLTLSNVLIIVFTIGILRPVAQARRLRYLVKRLSFSGTADLNQVRRGQEQAGLQGAGLEAAFSIEIF